MLGPDDSAETWAIVRRFSDAATRMGAYLAANDGDRDEYAVESDRLDAAYADLAAREAQDQLEPLLRSTNPWVRLYAAKMLLLSNESRAKACLEELRRQPAPWALAGNAIRFLTHWEMGALFPTKSDYPDDAVFFE